MIWNRGILIAVLATLLCGAGGKVPPRPTVPRKASPAETRTVRLSEREIATIWVHPEGTVLSFPAKPSQVIVGREHQFDVQYVDADVAVVALTPDASASAFIYLLGRRYGLSLKTSKERGDRLVFIRDALDTIVDVEIE